MTPAEQARCLFRLYEQKMYRVAFAILKDEGRAEDAVMDAFEKVIARHLLYDPRSEDMQRVVLSAVKSAAIDIYRKQARERVRVAYPGDDVLVCMGEHGQPDAAWLGGGAAAPDGAVAAEELLEGLPGPYRAVLHDRFVEDLSVAETASDLGITEPNVRKRQERALKALRRQMGANHGA